MARQGVKFFGAVQAGDHCCCGVVLGLLLEPEVEPELPLLEPLGAVLLPVLLLSGVVLVPLF